MGQKSALVFGAGGFIGDHLVRRLKDEGFWVRGVDLKLPRFRKTAADDFMVADLRDRDVAGRAVDRRFDEIYQLAADMGGAGFVFTGENDADIMHNSAMINLNILDASVKRNCSHIFYSSSACIYPEYNQLDPENPNCAEDSAYPAAPDSEYGWEKLFSERLYFAYKRNFGMNTRVARYHNIYGPFGSWNDGREKAPAAMCRKAASLKKGLVDEMEVWGPGTQTRSFLFIDDCLDATLLHSRGAFDGVVNIGSEEMVSINDLARLALNAAGSNAPIKNVDGPVGVMGRNSDNNLIESVYQWSPKVDLTTGIGKTYEWISQQ